MKDQYQANEHPPNQEGESHGQIADQIPNTKEHCTDEDMSWKEQNIHPTHAAFLVQVRRPTLQIRFSVPIMGVISQP